MNASPKTTSSAPLAAASLIRVHAFSVVASRSRKTGVAWTAATVTMTNPPPTGSASHRAAARTRPGRVCRVSQDPPPLRVGIIGAARIAPLALIRPAGRVPGVTVAAIAARDRARAERFATKHGIDRVHSSYDE